MPHRKQEFVELCSVCKARTERFCLRCGSPCCPEHEPPEDERCAGCEDAFLQTLEERERRTLVWFERLPLGLKRLLFVTLVGLGVGLGSAVHLFAGIVLVSVAVLFDPRRPPQSRSREGLRNAFLLERCERALLPAATEQSEHASTE